RMITRSEITLLRARAPYPAVVGEHDIVVLVQRHQLLCHLAIGDLAGETDCPGSWAARIPEDALVGRLLCGDHDERDLDLAARGGRAVLVHDKGATTRPKVCRACRAVRQVKADLQVRRTRSRQGDGA